MFCFHHHLLRSSFLNLFKTGCQVHVYATRFVTNYRPHFCRTNSKQFTVTYFGPKYGIPFHYPFQVPPLLLILRSVFGTFFLVPLKLTEFYCIIMLPPSPNLFRSMIISWGDLLVQTFGFLRSRHLSLFWSLYITYSTYFIKVFLLNLNCTQK